MPFHAMLCQGSRECDLAQQAFHWEDHAVRVSILEESRDESYPMHMMFTNVTED